LPIDIREASSLNIFKRKLKTYLFTLVMAARMDAAASSAPVWCFVFMFLYSFFCLLVNICEANYVYSCQDFIDFGWQQKLSVTQNFQWTHKIPEDIARLPGSPWIVGRPSDVGGVGTGSKNEEAGPVCLQGYVNHTINH